MDVTALTSISTPIQALPQSKLGTKEHWDSVYQREVQAYSEIGDEGEVCKENEEVSLSKTADALRSFRKPCRVLDLGCGNGHLLFSILGSKSPDEDDEESEEESDSENEDQEEDAENEEIKSSTVKASSNASLTKPQYCLGIDYSKLSIDLAKEISLKRGNGCENVGFQVSDLMQEDQVEQVRKSSMEFLNEKEKSGREEGWDLVCDKGTLDAIALSSLENSIPNYLKAVKRLTLSKEGLFIITSCNFTEKELSQMFTDTKDFEIEAVVPTPSFSFGGQKGSTTTTMVFRRL